MPSARQPALDDDLVRAARRRRGRRRSRSRGGRGVDELTIALRREPSAAARPTPSTSMRYGAPRGSAARARCASTRRALGGEADDDVGQVGCARGAVEAGVQAVGDGHRGARHRRGEQRRRPRRPRRARRLTRLEAPVAQRSTRSAAPWPPRSWVTRTTARPSSAASRSRASTAAPGLGVEVAGRLVGEQERRVVDERARDGEALLLAAGELVGEPRRRRRQPEASISARPRAGAPRRAPGSRAGSRTFSSPVSSGTRWKNWKTKPTRARRSARELALGAAVDALAGDLDACRPRGGRAPPRRCRSVDLPEPERPTTATSSPGARRRGRRRRARGARRGRGRRSSRVRAR